MTVSCAPVEQRTSPRTHVLRKRSTNSPSQCSLHRCRSVPLAPPIGMKLTNGGSTGTFTVEFNVLRKPLSCVGRTGCGSAALVVEKLAGSNVNRIHGASLWKRASERATNRMAATWRGCHSVAEMAEEQMSPTTNAARQQNWGWIHRIYHRRFPGILESTSARGTLPRASKRNS